MFNEFCKKEGIIHEVTLPYSLKLDKVVEKKNITLKEMMNSKLVCYSTPNNLWEEVILSACHIQNKIPYKKTRKTPL